MNRIPRLTIAATLCALSLGVSTLYGQGTVRWTGATNTAWETASNWAVVSGSPSTPPAANDAVQLGTGAITNQPAISVATTIASLSYGNVAASTLTINANLTVTGAITNTITTTARVHNINLSSGVVLSAASVNFSPAVAAANMTIVFNGGTFDVSGSLTAQPTIATTNITLTVGTGTLSVGGTTLQGATVNAQRNCDITVSTGTLLFAGNYTKDGAGSDLTATGAASVSFGGNVTNTRGTSFNLSSATPATTTFTGLGNVTPTTSMTFGHVVVNDGDTVTTASGAGTLTIAGNLTLNGSGALNGTEPLLLTGANATIDGTGSIGAATTVSQPHSIQATANLTMTGAMTLSSVSGDINNSGIVTASSINGTVGGATWTNLANSILNVSGTLLSTGTLAATNNPNMVNYNGGAAQTIKGTTYYNLNVSNDGAIATLGGNVTVNNDFTVSSGQTTIGAFTFSVGGTTSITDTLNITSTTGTKTFNNLIINSGGLFNNSGNEAITINGNIQNDGTLTSGTGIYTLAGTTKTISGGTATTITNISITGSYTNSGTLTVSTALTGAGSFTNDSAARLSIGATAANFTVTTFNASAQDNTVDYNALAAQTIRVPTGSAYHHLTVSGFGAKTAGGSLTVNGDFTITGFASFNGGASLAHDFLGNWIVTTSIATPFAFTTSSTVNFNTPTTPGATSLSGSTASTIAFNSVNINNTSGFNSSLNLSASGNFTIGSGATFTPDEAVVLGGTGTLTGSGTAKVTRTTATADFLTQYSIANKTLTNLTVEYEAGGGQSINALNYFNLTIRGARGSNDVTFSAGTVGISGAFSPVATFSTGGFVVAGNTFDYNGSGAQVITVFNYNNLTSSSTGPRTFEASGTIGVAGTFTPGTNSYTITGSTIDYNGSSAQSVAVFDYNNLTLSTSGTKTFGSGITRVGGTFTLGGAASADPVTNGSTIEYNGAGVQATPSIAYSGLTVNNASGIQITGDITVSGTLTFTSGTIATNANKVSLTSTASVSRLSGHVVGNLEKYIPSGTPTETFEVGSALAYTPVTVAFAGVTTPGTLNVQTVSTDHAEILTSGIEASKSVNRYWVMTGSGLAFTTFDATFNFVSGDIDGGANTTTFIVARRSGGLWSLPTVGTHTATSTQATGITGFGDFQIGEPAAGALKTWDAGAGTNNWGDANNWNPDGVPQATDNVSLTGANNIVINVAAACNSITFNNSSLLVTIQAGNSLTASGDLSLVSGTLNTESSFPSVTGTLSITGGTVGYTALGSQTVQPLNYNHLSLSGSGTKTFASGTTNIAGDFTVSAITADATTNSTTIQFSGSSAQAVGAINYYNLTFSNAGIKTFAAGTTGIAAVFSVTGAASANATANNASINYNGSGSQDINQIDYHHLTISGGGTKTFASGTTKIEGDLVISGVIVDATTNSTTVEFNGNGAQTVGPINYHNLVLSNAGVKTFAAGSTSISNSFTMTGSATADALANSATLIYNGSGAQDVTPIEYHHLTLTNGGTKTFGVGTTKIAGDFTVTGSASGNTSTNNATIEFNGTTSQNTPSITYVGLTINNTSGIALTGDATVTDVLTLIAGNISTGSNKITLSTNAVVSRTSGQIVGNFEKQIPTNFGGVSRTFEVGDASTYTPVTVAFASVFTSGYLTVSTTPGDHPQILTAGIDGSKSVNRYWTLTNNGIVFSNYSATFDFVAGDIDAGANTANFNISRLSGGSWNTTTIGTRTSTSTQATGLTGFGDFQIGEAGAAAMTWDGGAGSNNWGDASNWSPNGVPTSSDNVSLSGSITLNIDIAASCNSITLNNASLSVTILVGSSLTVAGNLSLVNGTLSTQDAFPSVSGTTTISGGTVAYTGTGVQNVLALEYNHLSISGAPDTSVHKTVAGDVTINGTITIAVNNTLDMQNFSIPTLGASSNSGKIMWQGSNSQVLAGAGTTEFYGGLAATVKPGTYGNVLFTGSGTKTISGAVIATGGASASEGVAVMNNLTITNNGSLTITGMDLNNLGSITNNGVISVNP